MEYAAFRNKFLFAGIIFVVALSHRMDVCGFGTSSVSV